MVVMTNDIQIGSIIVFNNDIDYPRIVLDVRKGRELEMIVAPVVNRERVSLWVSCVG